MNKAKTGLKSIDTPIYGYWSAMYYAFYSKRLYVDVGKRWKGLGLLYLLLVIAIGSIPLSLVTAYNFNQLFNQQLIDPILQLPTLYVQNGEVSIDKPMPYLVKNKKNQVVAIVDTTGSIDSFSEKYPHLTILINKDKMSYKVPTPQIFLNNKQLLKPQAPIVQTFDKTINSVFDGHQFVTSGAVTGLKYVSELLVYPVSIATVFSIFIVLFPVVALLAQLYSNIFFSFHITYKQALRLLIVSATPMLVALFILLMFNIIFPGLGFILLALLGAYYSFSLYSLKAESLQVVSL